MINNFFIKKGYSYIQAVERENYLSYSLLNKFICIMINSKLRIIISQFKNNYHYLIFKNVITKLKKNKILNTTNEIKYNKLELLSKKKKLDTNIEIGTYKYFFDKYINNKYTKNIDNENKITKLNTEKDNYKINRRHSVSFRPSPIVNLNKNYKQTRRFSMVI